MSSLGNQQTIPNSVFYNFLSLKCMLVYLPIDQTRLAKSVEAARIKEAPASQSNEDMAPFDPDKALLSSQIFFEISQILTRLSDPPVASVRPCGLHLTALTSPSWAQNQNNQSWLNTNFNRCIKDLYHCRDDVKFKIWGC